MQYSLQVADNVIRKAQKYRKQMADALTYTLKNNRPAGNRQQTFRPTYRCDIQTVIKCADRYNAYVNFNVRVYGEKGSGEWGEALLWLSPPLSTV
jgi:hypothetical protein